MGEWFQNHWLDVIGVLGTIFGVAGIVATYVFYRRSKQEKKPRYHIKNWPILVGWKETLPDLSIHYRGHGEDIPNLSIADVLLWNDGNMPIHEKEVPKSGQLMITAKDGCKIVGHTILKRTNEHNRFSTAINREKTRILVDFEFINGMDGVLIRVIHTGTNTSDLTVSGAFVGADLQPYGIMDEATKLKNDRITRRIVVVTFLVVIGCGVLVTVVELITSPKCPTWPMFLGAAIPTPFLLALRRIKYRHKILRKLNIDW
jgi:hypothetical protein